MDSKLVPGTVLPFTGNDGMFAMFRPMIHAANGLSLSQVCAITGLEPSTVQNWIKRGFVAHPVQKKYFSRQLARILLIGALRDGMNIDRIGELMRMVNGSADDESDDIISDEQLYDYFCEVVRRLDHSTISRDYAAEVIAEVTEGYTGPDASAPGRLRWALLTMVFGFISGKLRQESETCFQQMQKDFLKERET
ncbi:MAG: DUF1836 domain-containing protein [Acutalibacteraceae bacterium]